MGRTKQSLQVDGVTLLDRSIAAAREAGCDPIVVVIGAGAAAMRQVLASHAVQVAENPDWPLGMGGSIRRGVTALLSDHPRVNRIVLLLCDQPLVSADTIRRLDAQQRTSASRCVFRRTPVRSGRRWW